MLVDMIDRLTPQCQPHLRSNANKTTVLRKAVIGLKWAMTPIENITAVKYTFEGFVIALREHLQLDKKLPSSRSVHDGMQRSYEDPLSQRYGRNPKHVSKHQATKTGLQHGSNQLPKLFSKSQAGDVFVISVTRTGLPVTGANQEKFRLTAEISFREAGQQCTLCPNLYKISKMKH